MAMFAFMAIAGAGKGGVGLLIPGQQAFRAGITPPSGFYLTQGVLFHDGKVGMTLNGGPLDADPRRTAVPLIANFLCRKAMS